jgi:hypothetical protein
VTGVRETPVHEFALHTLTSAPDAGFSAMLVAAPRPFSFAVWDSPRNIAHPETERSEPWTGKSLLRRC